MKLERTNLFNMVLEEYDNAACTGTPDETLELLDDSEQGQCEVVGGTGFLFMDASDGVFFDGAQWPASDFRPPSPLMTDLGSVDFVLILTNSNFVLLTLSIAAQITTKLISSIASETLAKL